MTWPLLADCGDEDVDGDDNDDTQSLSIFIDIVNISDLISLYNL